MIQYISIGVNTQSLPHDLEHGQIAYVFQPARSMLAVWRIILHCKCRSSLITEYIIWAFQSLFDYAVFEFMCVLWWLIRPVFALNCLLKIEQVNSESDDWWWSLGSGFALFALSFSHADSLIHIICSLSDEATPFCPILCTLFQGLWW